MAWIPRSVTAIGLILLVHACYSAQEHAALHALRMAAAVTTTTTTTAATASASSAPVASASLPIDISIETVIAIIVTSIGLVMSTPWLRPIQWREWAGKIEREGEDGFKNSDGDVPKDYVGNPFRLLETRPGFVDIRKQKKEFAEWVKSSGGAS